MKNDLEIGVFVNHCSDIQISREAALATTSPYRVYLDRENGYPQIKIIAQTAQEYEAMDRFLEHPSSLSNIPGAKNYFAIHDNYSHYPSHDHFTYTIPLTHANFLVLSHLYAKKKSFELITTCYQEFVTRLPKDYARNHATSIAYATYQMLINYGSWIENQHLFTQMPGNDATHIELLREWQARLCSDPIACLFITDEGNPILNDILLAENLISPETITDYQDRYQLETKHTLKLQQYDIALQALTSREDIALCGIRTKAMDIFSPYEFTAAQCQNTIYKLQTDHLSFKTKLQTEPDLQNLHLSVPGQSCLIQNLYSNNRWNIDGSTTGHYEYDLSHLAWQCGVYYQSMDAVTREQLRHLGLERLANPHYNDALVYLPYSYYKLLVLAINIQSTQDADVKEIWLDRSIKLIETWIETSCIQTIPQAIIIEIEKFFGSTDLRTNRYKTINQQYFLNTVYPKIRHTMLETAQMIIRDWNQTLPNQNLSYRETGYVANIWCNATQAVESFVIKRDNNAALLEAITALPDPYAFSLEFVQRFAEHTSVPGLSRLGPTLNN